MNVTEPNKLPGLYLEDGSFFWGKSGFGNAYGHVVMVNSSNFVEIPTDKSASGLLLCFSFPEAGYAPLRLKEMETFSYTASGVIIGRIAATKDGEALRSFYRDLGIALLEGVDTRALAIHLSQNALKGELYSGTQLSTTTNSIERFRMPNSGKTLAVFGEAPNSLLKDLVCLGYELILYKDRLPLSFNQVDGILCIDGLEDSYMTNLSKASLPILALSSACQSFAVYFGGKVKSRALFNDRLAVTACIDKNVLTASFRITKTIEEAPGQVLYAEHYSQRPVGFIERNVTCIEFLPDRALLASLLERRCNLC